MARSRTAVATLVALVAVFATSVGAHANPVAPGPKARVSPGAEATAPAATEDQQPALAKEGPKHEAPKRRRRAKAKRRGGVNPCMTPDPGWGVYDRWTRNISMGQMMAPHSGGITPSGAFDLIVHFHGHYPIRKEFVKSANGVVLVAIDLGIGSGAYSGPFASPNTFTNLIKSVEAEMARRHGRKKARVRRLGLSSWSAGYGAIAQILEQPAGKKVDTLILLDSVYGSYADASKKTLVKASLEPFVKFARQAARGTKFMFHSYSSIIPPGYASTGEVGRYIIGRLGGKVRRAKRNDVLGLTMFERYDRGNYHVRGYRGDDKPDHCAHLGLIKDVLKVHVKRRWKSPRGRAGKSASAVARKANTRKGGTVHVVASGDHLGGIARRYGTTVSALRKANNLEINGRPIQPGQELTIPKGAKKTPKARAKNKKKKKKKRKAGGKIHVVADGQSLGRIARRYHVTVAEIVDANDIDRRKPIRPGQELVIPTP